jgi:hypothetical protein
MLLVLRTFDLPAGYSALKSGSESYRPYGYEQSEKICSQKERFATVTIFSLTPADLRRPLSVDYRRDAGEQPPPLGRHVSSQLGKATASEDLAALFAQNLFASWRWICHHFQDRWTTMSALHVLNYFAVDDDTDACGVENSVVTKPRVH